MRFSAFGALVLLVLHLLCAATRDADLEARTVWSQIGHGFVEPSLFAGSAEQSSAGACRGAKSEATGGGGWPGSGSPGGGFSALGPRRP